MDLYTMMIKYIEFNKESYGINYDDSLKYIQELVDTIKKEYDKIKDSQ